MLVILYDCHPFGQLRLLLSGALHIHERSLLNPAKSTRWEYLRLLHSTYPGPSSEIVEVYVVNAHMIFRALSFAFAVSQV